MSSSPSFSMSFDLICTSIGWRVKSQAMERLGIMAALLLLVSLDVALTEEQIDLDAFGGDPVVSAEIGATPQQNAADDPEVAFPTQNTCRQEGVTPTDCSQECLFGCKTPICSMSCLCACTSAEGKSTLMTILRREEREINLLAVQRDMWKAGQIGMTARGEVPNALLITAESAVQKMAAIDGNRGSEDRIRRQATSVRNPRFRRHVIQKQQQQQQQESVQQKQLMMKAIAYNAVMTQAAAKAKAAVKAKGQSGLTDAAGFDWNSMQQSSAHNDRAMTALGRESDKIDDVYDPAEDPDNIGPGDDGKKDAQWWGEDSLKGSKLNDQWWEHGGEQGMTG